MSYLPLAVAGVGIAEMHGGPFVGDVGTCVLEFFLQLFDGNLREFDGASGLHFYEPFGIEVVPGSRGSGRLRYFLPEPV